MAVPIRFNDIGIMEREMSMVNPQSELVGKMYDHFMFKRNSLQNKLGFLNVGYWKGVEDSVELAQINLIETLAQFFVRRDGNLLDVACGMGASTRFMTKYFEPRLITGINIIPRQLEVCRVNAPECQFAQMDAADLKFGDESFDNILCIEAAFHFLTRRKFLQHAHRVLKPGGRLAMSDILFGQDVQKVYDSVPQE